MKFVEIHSNLTITVTPGLQGLDVTNPDAHVPDQLNVKSQWGKATIQIKKGVDTYPAYITEWNTVKSLARIKVLTIGAIIDETDAKKIKEAEKLERTLNEIKETKKAKKEKSLADVAGD